MRALTIEEAREAAVKSRAWADSESDKRLAQAVKENDMHYITRRFSNVPVRKIIQALIHKFI